MKTSPASAGPPAPAAKATAIVKPLPVAPDAGATQAPRTFVRSWTDFWFSAISPCGLHGLRVLTGLLLLAWALPFAGQIEAMFSLQGWMDAQAYRQASRLTDGAPVPIDWSLFYLAGDNLGVVQALYWAGIVVFFLFTLGIASRLTGVLSWVMVVSLMANPAIRFEADYLLSILTFYLMVGYLLYGQWNGKPGVAARLLGPRDAWVWHRDTDEPRPSYAANLVARFLQVHFALIVVTSALHKLQFGSWWSGVAFWYPLHSPFRATEEQLRTLTGMRDGYLFVLSLAQYLVLAWQLTFPLFAWRTGKWRWVLLGGGMVGWIGTIYVYQAPLFGPAFLIGYMSFLTPGEWDRLRGWLLIHREERKERKGQRRPE